MHDWYHFVAQEQQFGLKTKILKIRKFFIVMWWLTRNQRFAHRTKILCVQVPMNATSEKYRSRQVFQPQIQSGVFPFPLRKFFREVFLTVRMPILGTWRHSSAKMHFNDPHYYLKICHIGCFWYFFILGNRRQTHVYCYGWHAKEYHKNTKIAKIDRKALELMCFGKKKQRNPF